MRRGPVMWTISILGAILVILAVALAGVGTLQGFRRSLPGDREKDLRGQDRV